MNVIYTPAPWATGHTLWRAPAAGGAFVQVASDTTPGPALAKQRSDAARGIVALASGLAGATAVKRETAVATTTPASPVANGTVTLAPAPSAIMLVATVYTLRDEHVVPEAEYLYRITAAYTDSAPASVTMTSPAKSAPVSIGGLMNESNGEQTLVFWDTLRVRPSFYALSVNGTPISLGEVFNSFPGRQNVSVTADQDAAVTYELRAIYPDGGVARGVLHAKPTPVVGFSDTHTHQFASESFGGMPLPGLLQGQISESQLRAAHDAGLQLMVVLAVNNEVGCRGLTPVRAGSAAGRFVVNGTPPTVLSCDDSSNVERQLTAARAFEARVEAEDPAPGSGFYRIVQTPTEARRAIRQGKLAVVLGIEVDNVFGCGSGSQPHCTSQQMVQRLDRYFALGVRQINPIHLADNGLGGFAFYSDLFLFNSWGLNGTFPTYRDCSATGIRYRFTPAVVAADAANVAAETAQLAAMFSSSVASDLIGAYAAGIPKSAAAGMCNTLGLTPLGEQVIGELMMRGMIIDVDHMSQLSAGRTLQLTAQRGYPVISAHSGLIEATNGGKRAEGNRSPSQADSIRQNGGTISLGAHQGSSRDIAAFPSSLVPNDCDGSTKAWAQMYQATVRQLGGYGTAAVGIGSDFNGIDETVVPRFGPEACKGNLPQAAAQANRTNTDFDTQGLANIGLYGAFIQDLKNVGLTDAQLAPLRRSAESYIETWERAVGASRP